MQTLVAWRTMDIYSSIRVLAWRTLLLVIAWTYDVPVAEADCGTPPEIEGAAHNLTGSPPYPTNLTARYFCQLGYDGVGTSNIYQCNGTDWVGEGWQCIERLCSFLDPPDNGLITNNPSYTIGSHIEFACREGYSLEGPSYRRCRVDGWTSDSPTCQIKFCNEFEGVQNAAAFQESLDGVYNDFGSEITITCHDNYVMSGSSRVVCGADGQWSPAPTCQRSACPSYPVSASRCTSRAYLMGDDIYNLECVEETANTSATRVGEEWALCINNEWTDTTLACYCNCKVPVTSHVLLHNVDANNFLRHGEVLRWSCSLGSKLSDTDFLCEDGNIGRPVCVLPTSTTTSTTTTSTTTTSTTTTSTSTTTTSTAHSTSTTPNTTATPSALTTTDSKTNTTPSTTTTTLSAQATTDNKTNTTPSTTTTTLSAPTTTDRKTNTTPSSLNPVHNTITTPRSNDSTVVPYPYNTSTQVTLIPGARVTTQSALASIEVGICKCACKVDIDRELLQNITQGIDIKAQVRSPAICWMFRSAKESRLYCDFGHLGTSNCQRSAGRSTDEFSAEIWKSVSDVLSEQTEKDLTDLCLCTNAVDAPRSNGMSGNRLSNIYQFFSVLLLFGLYK